jgi:hypothetical protein
MSITYRKNHRGFDHRSIFQEQDRGPVGRGRPDYSSHEENGETLMSDEMAFTRPLKNVVPRLELLGFNLARVRREYNAVARNWEENRDDDEHCPELMSFEEFVEFIAAHPINSLDDTPFPSFVDPSEEQMRSRFGNTDFDRIPRREHRWDRGWSEKSFYGILIAVLHPYSILRILAEIEANKDHFVVWQYGPLIEAGWATERDFTFDARRTETFLIATEGKSDVHILKHALALLRPGIADFFRFIDAQESHPFSGTASLGKFAEGLAKIDVHNQVIFLFDNDAEGVYEHRRMSKLSLPANMRGIVLPELEEFRSFPTQGPEGCHRSDINGRAAAIECYLDLDADDCPPPIVRWSNYKKEMDVYQGALNEKDRYKKGFLSQTSETLTGGTYDVRKIEAVLDCLVAECVAIAVDDENRRRALVEFEDATGFSF